MLCKDCKQLVCKKVGNVSYVHWCNMGKANKYGKKLGVDPWIEKPHPKCPLKSKNDG